MYLTGPMPKTSDAHKTALADDVKKMARARCPKKSRVERSPCDSRTTGEEVVRDAIEALRAEIS